MLRRLRRVPSVLLPLVLLGTLAACGNDNGSDASSGPLSAVSISGDPGKAPEVSWKQQMETTGIQSTVLHQGDGPEVKDGDSIYANFWIGDGYTKKKAYSTYDTGQPQLIKVDSSSLSPVFKEAVEGHTIGSRVAVTAPADKAFGPTGNPNLEIGNKDAVLIIVDLLSTVLDGPQGAQKPAPAWAPKLETKGDAVTGLDFSKAPKPDGKLHSAVLIEGTGATVAKGQTITVNYLGQVYGGKKPFDESYSKGQPTSFGIGTGQVIPGWDKTLVGQHVGSRVLLAIPPKDGYGKQGQPSAGIKGDDTLYFVVDILGAH